MPAQTDEREEDVGTKISTSAYCEDLSSLNEEAVSAHSRGQIERGQEPRRKLAFAYYVLIRVSDLYSIDTDPDPAF
jgi:hypothetical protein